MFVEVGTFKHAILAAVDSIKADPSKECRSLGSVCQCAIDYFESNPVFAGVRLLTFIGGQPNYGIGSCDTSATSVSKLREAVSKLTSFYQNMGQRAARAAVCIDMFVISSNYTKLSALQYLSSYTGGIIMLCQSLEDASLPQDLYRHYCDTLGWRGLLRLRTSQDIQLTRPHGHFMPDEEYDFLYHVAGCDKSQSFTFDFDFTGDGFPKKNVFPPTIQLAFAYSILSKGADDDNQETKLKRMLRVVTIQADIAVNMRQLYSSLEPDVSATLMMHKLARVVVAEGVEQARSLLKDWLVVFVDKYIGHLAPNREAVQFDLDYPEYPSLSLFSKLLFGATKSPLLRPTNVSPDERIFHQYVFSCMQPAHVARTIFPHMCSYATPDYLDAKGLGLTRHVITASSSPIFVLDAYSIILVYYGINASEFAFPPPVDSPLRKHINQLRTDRTHTPALKIIRAGTPDAQLFYSYLLEDTNAFGPGYREYYDVILADVKRLHAA
eukprot:TRINITY_DN2355_c0_g2_i3.p1 TRINITY_DN2355_c0_g2~~TRINITY_DN2355_c0_g2_i3.p1  ORF type:complete len:495 (-),score=99.48 TRINITY_DN2355_c0_g2_i3:52-1536(-)